MHVRVRRRAASIRPQICAASATSPLRTSQRRSLDPQAGTGWDIAALSDSNYDFDQSCGACQFLWVCLGRGGGIMCACLV
jgi:hypothetical protein